MNLRSVDLNLLVVLDALLEEAHVSRAAQRLALSQPATSSALERCRHLFGDSLLVRAGSHMRLTPKAEALRDPLKQVLAEVTAVIDPAPPDLKDIRQTVSIETADLPAIMFVGPLQKSLEKSAPGIDIVVKPWHGADEALDALGRGTTDLALSVFPTIETGYQRVQLSYERYVVVMDKAHPAAGEFSLETWLRYPHIVVSGKGARHGPLDDVLAERCLTRRIGMVVPSFLVVPALLAGSTLMAMISYNTLPPEAGDTLAIFEPPIPVDRFPLHLAWHRRTDKDIAVQHVAGLVRSIFARLEANAQAVPTSTAQRPGATP